KNKTNRTAIYLKTSPADTPQRLAADRKRSKSCLSSFTEFQPMEDLMNSCAALILLAHRSPVSQKSSPRETIQRSLTELAAPNPAGSRSQLYRQASWLSRSKSKSARNRKIACPFCLHHLPRRIPLYEISVSSNSDRCRNHDGSSCCRGSRTERRHN